MIKELSSVIEELVEKGKFPKKAIAQSMKETGKKAIGCFPIYAPEEIIYAAGMLPVGLWGGNTETSRVDKYLPSFCCSVMKVNMELGMRGSYDILSAVVIPAYCDSMRAVLADFQLAVPQLEVIGMVYPQNRLEKPATDYMVRKFEVMQEKMERIGETVITDEDLERAFQIYEDYRSTMREFVAIAKEYPKTINAKVRHYIIKAAFYMDKPVYTQKVRRIIELLKDMPKETARLNVVATGLILEPEALLDIFVENEIAIVEDDFAQESRQFRTLTRQDEGSVYEKMAWRIIDLKGCTFFYEEQKSKGDMLIEMYKRNNADLVLSCIFKFCDPEEFDYPVYKKELEQAGVPLMYMEIDQVMDSVEQLRTRLQSAVEIYGR